MKTRNKYNAKWYPRHSMTPHNVSFHFTLKTCLSFCFVNSFSLSCVKKIVRRVKDYFYHYDFQIFASITIISATTTTTTCNINVLAITAADMSKKKRKRKEFPTIERCSYKRDTGIILVQLNKRTPLLIEGKREEGQTICIVE